MKILLTADVRSIGRKGQIVDVAEGYARNFLLARKLGTIADDKTRVAVEKNIALKKHHEAEQLEKMRALAMKLKDTAFDFHLRTDAKGNLFGAVSTETIASALRQHHDLGPAHVTVALEHPIKKIGDYSVVVDFGKGITAPITVRVRPQI